MSMYPRPATVTGLSIVHVIIGLGVMLLGFSGDASIAKYMLIPELGTTVQLTALVLLGATMIVGGFLMWRGPVVGWYYAIVMFVSATIRNAAGFILIEDVLDEFGMPINGIAYYYAEYVFRAALAVICVSIFMSRPVTDFFGVSSHDQRRAVVVVTAVCLVLAVGFYFIRHLFV